MRILKDYHHFDGLAWATGYVTNALAYQGVTAPHTGQPYTEAMLMGINGGLCAGYFSFDYQGWDPHLHFLTRYLFDEQPGALFGRLGIPMTARQTTDPEKGVANVLNALAQGKPAIVWADVASFPYNVAAFDHSPDTPQYQDYYMVMPLLVYGLDLEADTVYIVDRARVPLTVSVERFKAARVRLAKTRQRMMTIDAPDPAKLPQAVEEGIRACISIFVDKPPVGAKSSFGFDAYKKWANLLTDTKNKKAWAKEFAPGRRMFAGLTSAYRYLEVFFTGGSGARDIYADFLLEAADVLQKPALREVSQKFRLCAERWRTLTAALLPDHIAPFREARELMCHNYALFLTQAGDSIETRRANHKRFQEIRATMDSDFPLTAAEAATMRAELREHILRLHDAEYDAIMALKAAAAN